MKKVLLISLFSLLWCNIGFSQDFTFGQKMNETSAKGITKAGTNEKIYSKDKELKIEGQWSEKFVIGHGDCGQDGDGWSDCRSDRARSEQKRDYKTNKNNWFKFSIFVPEDWEWKSGSKNKSLNTMIFQSKASETREPIWNFKLYQEGGNPVRWEGAGLILKFGLSSNDRSKNTCLRPLLKWNEILGKWNDFVFYVNYSKKTPEWLKVNENEYFAALWVNGKRLELDCANKINMPKGILGEFKNRFSRKGAILNYGIYQTRVGEYLLGKAHASGMCKNKDENCGLDIKWRKDKGGDAMKETRYIKNWTQVDWPIKHNTYRIWFDKMEASFKGKNIWNLPLEINDIRSKPKPLFYSLAKSKSKPNDEYYGMDPNMQGKANVGAMKKCLEIYSDCEIVSRGIFYK